MNKTSNETCNGLFVTDFDGTLLCSDGTFNQRDLDALKSLSAQGIKTAVATGRSLYSFDNSPGVDLPVDYIAFTMGAGVVEQSSRELLYRQNITPESVVDALGFFEASDFDFMLHHAVPENHRFYYRRANSGNTDFETRIGRYHQFSEPLDAKRHNGFGEAAQFLAVVPQNKTDDALRFARNGLQGLSVIRTTSPLDHRSTWIEFFHPGVSKGSTASWLASKLGVDRTDTMAVGNDYNDMDLLEWAGSGFVVDNSPVELKERFCQVASNNQGGVADAVERWLDGR